MIICEGKIATVKDLYHVALRATYGQGMKRARRFPGICIDMFTVRAKLFERRHTLASWSRERGYFRCTVHNAIVGRRTGPSAKRIVKTLRRELGI